MSQEMEKKETNVSFRREISDVISLKELESPRFEKKPLLKEAQVGEIHGVPLYTYPQADFTRFPNTSLGKKLNAILGSSSNTEVYLRLVLIAGGTPALWSLLTKGLSTGLSGGTMDIIYRIGVPPKVHGLLDNIDIAIGSLQRRVQNSNIIAELLSGNGVQRVLSIAGGSCLIPLEGIYQSGKYGVQIINVDSSPKANEKAEQILKTVKKDVDIGIGIRYLPSDILNEGIPDEIDSQEPQIVECTGFWEYLNPSDREKLLNRIARSLKPSDVFVLSALTDNPQHELFNKMGFKKLNPQPMDEYFSQVKDAGLNIKKIYLTPNQTYTAFVIS